MTLQEIRETKTFDQLKPAIKFLCDNMQKLTWGEFNAFRSTIESQSLKVGSNIKQVNEYADSYRIFGYELK